jgi:hypothetical protein
MPGFDPGIHEAVLKNAADRSTSLIFVMDYRVKPGNDGAESLPIGSRDKPCHGAVTSLPNRGETHAESLGAQHLVQRAEGHLGAGRDEDAV